MKYEEYLKVKSTVLFCSSIIRSRFWESSSLGNGFPHAWQIWSNNTCFLGLLLKTGNGEIDTFSDMYNKVFQFLEKAGGPECLSFSPEEYAP